MVAKSREQGKPALGRVLIVEDDAVLALALEDVLSDHAGEVVICPSIAATMVELERERPDALVIDVHLADRDDGWALVELVDMLGTRRPRIVFSTGAPQEIPPKIAEVGAVFEKPYDPADLLAALSGEEKRGLFSKLRSAIG